MSSIAVSAEHASSDPIPLRPRFGEAELRDIGRTWPLDRLMVEAAAQRDDGHGATVSYSSKVFIPLTRLCRDVCHYCTFAQTPRARLPIYLEPEQVLAIARAGQAAGCKEALFTLGDKPELRYSVARAWLDARGFATTIDYLAYAADLVFRETGLFPHVNPGVMSTADIAKLRPVSVSMGLMLESSAERLCGRGGPHFGSPDKQPAVRLDTIRRAGEARVPFTSGILIGIGETRDERLDALFALRELHAQFGHLQEVIVQNFRAKPDTRMAVVPNAEHDDLKWTIAMARMVFGAHMNIQAPPNLSDDRFADLVGAGLNDWGGVSPVTPDHVNPEATWPQIETLARSTAEQNKVLVERLASYPAYVSPQQVMRWHDPRFVTPLLRATDATGLVRDDTWSPGLSVSVNLPRPAARASIWSKLTSAAAAGRRLEESQVVRLFEARGADFAHVLAAADELRRSVNGDTVSYVVNRNINYTNICGYKCRFCAFSKGTAKALRGAPYDLDLAEIVRRTQEAWERGGTEVCLQGGIHPDYTGATYLAVCRAIKTAVPGVHVHAFSPLEVSQGATTLGRPVADFLTELQASGLGSLPGTAAEILDDEVRRELCPDKLTAQQWFDVVEAAHRIGLKTTATIMFGHIDRPVHWARHLLAIRDLQERTGHFTEFVPLPFVHMEAPIYLKGASRLGPTFREVMLMHAVARLVLHPLIPNIQASWVKLGVDGVKAALNAGVNDLGGSLMNESISRAAGTTHGEELPPKTMERIICEAGRIPRQRTTLYGAPPVEQVTRSFGATALAPKREFAPRRGLPSRMAGAAMAAE
jgi:FO synthase